MTQSIQTHTKRPSIVSPGGRLRNTDQISQEVSALLQAVDSIRHSETENEELLRIALDDTAVLAMAREIGQAQGEQLDEEKLKVALEQVRTQRYVFQDPKSGLNGKIALAWTTRESWGPKWRMAGLGITTATALSVGSIVMIDNYQQNSWEEGMEATRSSEAQIRQALETSFERVQPQANAPLSVVQSLNEAHEAIRAGIDELGKAPSVPAGERLEDFWEQDKDQAKEILEARKQHLKRAWAQHETAKGQMNHANSLTMAFEQASVFSQPIAVALDGLRTRLRVEFQAAAEAGDVEGMRAAVDTLNSAIGAIRIRDALEAQASNMPANTRQQLMKRLEDATLSASTGEVDKANILLEETRSLIAQAGMAYTLRIVSEPGVSTGVWRYYDGDKSAKTFYILVDAIGADGNPIEMPITSVEDKTTKTTSRFALRVPEDVYNQIGEDKRDGIVDNDLMGEKIVGELEPNYAFPISGGAITNW